MWQILDELGGIRAIYKDKDEYTARQVCAAANQVIKCRVSKIELVDGSVVSGHQAILDGHGWHVKHVKETGDKHPARTKYRITY